MSLKVALINLEEDSESPAMGLVYIASYLENDPELKITIIDRCFDDVLLRIKELKPDVIGFSSKTIHYSLAIDLSKQIKSFLPNAFICVGGAHITTMPNSLDKTFNIGIIGEGEETFAEILSCFKKNNFKKLINIKGSVLWSNDKLKINGPRDLLVLDNLPLPNLSYINPKFIKNVNTGFGVGMKGYIITSRGCPFNCIYCSTKRVWSKLRFHSVDNIIDQIQLWVNHFNVHYIRIMDDLFGVSKERLLQIAEALEKSGLAGKVEFIASLRVNNIDDDFCKLLRRIGVRSVNFGFDSGNDRVLKMLKGDSVSVELIKNAVLTCQKYDILVIGSFIFASPTETISEMNDTYNLIEWMTKQKNVENIWTFVMTPLPATKIWTIAEQRGKISSVINWDDLSYYHETDPLLLDADYSEFIKLWTKTKSLLKVFKWRRVGKTITHNPVYVLKKSLKKPKLWLNLLFKQRVYD